MKRPLFPILGCLIGGMLIEHYAAPVPRLWTLFPGKTAYVPILLLYAALLGLWYSLYCLKYARLAMLILLLTVVSIGMTRYAVALRLPAQHIARLVQDALVTVEGFLYKPPETAVSEDGRTKRRLYVETIWLEHEGFRYRVCGKILITLTAASLPSLPYKSFAYGDAIRTRLRLSAPKQADDAGDFDYQAFLRRQGIYLIGSLRHDRSVIQLPEQQGNVVLKGIYALRSRLLRFLDDYEGRHGQGTGDAIQVIKAMTLGTNRELSPFVKEVCRRSGMYHLLVVSGIHIGILVWAGHHLLALCSIPVRYRSVILTVMLFLYAGVTGFQFPVLRAVIMAGVVYFALTCDRNPAPLYSLIFAVCLILLLSPMALFDVSLQLTVAATASILLWLRCWQRFPWWGRLLQRPAFIHVPLITMVMTVGAMIGIAPLTAYYFQQIFPASFASNLLALPVITLLLPLSLFADLLSLLLPWKMVAPVVSLSVLLAKGFLGIAGLFPEWGTLPARPTVLFILLYYVIVYAGLAALPGYANTRASTPE